MSELIQESNLDEGIVSLSLNRPQRLNALSSDLISALLAAFDRLGKDRDCRVIILTGAGRAFCSGADIKGDAKPPPGGEELGELGLVYKGQEHVASLMLAVREAPQPVIAAVNGAAFGGGLALALASDLRVVSEKATFCASFINIGLSACDVGCSYLLPQLVGASRAAELMLTGRIFDAEEAERLGLAHRVSSDKELMLQALELARLVASKSEFGAWMTKKGLWANCDAPSLRHAIELENRTQALAWFGGNMREAMEAFSQKRAPQWKRL